MRDLFKDDGEYVNWERMDFIPYNITDYNVGTGKINICIASDASNAKLFMSDEALFSPII